MDEPPVLRLGRKVNDRALLDPTDPPDPPNVTDLLVDSPFFPRGLLDDPPPLILLCWTSGLPQSTGP